MKYVQEFLTSRKLEGYAPGTLDQYQMELRYLPPFLQKPTPEATTNDLRLYLAQFKHLSERTFIRKVSTLKAFYSWLTDEEYIERNPMKKIKVPKEPTTLPKYLDEMEFEKFRYVKRSVRNKAIIELLVSSGMRVSELVAIDILDLDLNNRELTVIGKGNKERLVHFSNMAKSRLFEYLETRADNNPALFITRYGKRLTTRSIEQQIKREGERAGLRTKVTPHTLRHTFATHLIQRGADISFIADEMGHESADTTRRYARLDLRTRRDMYKKYMAI